MSEGSARNVGPTGDARVRERMGSLIRAARERAGLTQAQAAERIGVSRETVGRWERGEGSLWTGGTAGAVDYGLFKTTAEALGCKMSELLPRNQYPSAPLDPEKRREWVRRRNAQIQGVDPEEYLEMIREREARTAGVGDPKSK